MRETSAARQVAMVMDLNKCLGCHTCSVACKTLWTSRPGMQGMWWNSVSTQPGAGTPRNWEGMGGGFRDGRAAPGRLPDQSEFGTAWDFNYDEVFHGGQPNVPLSASPAAPAAAGANWDEDVGAGEYPNAYHFYLPRICNHCTRPACLEACPRAAISKRRQDGIVLIDEDRCRGYQFCAEACPYKKIYFNTVAGTSQKCIFCLPRIEQGVATACARQCPGRVRFLGFLDDTDGPVYKLVREFRVALPLHPEFGTEPNVFYVPPLSSPMLDEQGNPTEHRRIPAAYLEQLFGPEVHTALERIAAEIERRRAGQHSELMDLLISRRWLDMFKGFERHPRQLGPM